MGGATNCPETPRQKMIGMMYLVLTAMLALNVSAAILNGYTQVDESLHATIGTMEQSNADTYATFKVALEKNAAKTQENQGNMYITALTRAVRCDRIYR